MKTKKPYKQKGFTFFELICTLLLIAILAIGTLHFYTNLSHKYERRSLLENIAQQIKASRMIAFREKITVVLRANVGGWAQGWVAFNDVNRNFVQDRFEENIAEKFTKKSTSNQTLSTIVDTTGGCLAFDGQGLIQRCGPLQNLVLNGRIILSHDASSNASESINRCSNSSSLRILRHHTAAVCESRKYSNRSTNSNQDGFSGDCTCE